MYYIISGPRISTIYILADKIVLVVFNLMSTEFYTPIVYFCTLLFLWPSRYKEINNSKVKKFKA